MTLKSIHKKYEKITKILIEKNISITTMESCTSGFIASLITDTAGASSIIKGAFVSYSNEAKILLGVNPKTIISHGVYSCDTAVEMAKTCKAAFGADIGIGITGSFQNADPPNSDSKPGSVYYSIRYKDHNHTVQIKVPKFKTRFKYKLYVANKIANKLLKIITNS